MVSRYCPRCRRITSSSGNVNYCAWGCGSLKEEPILPPYSEWVGGYIGMIEKAHAEWEKREAEKRKMFEDIGNGRLQMKLFPV